MASVFHRVLYCLAAILISAGSSHSLVDSPCGDWIPFKDETCVKFLEHSALQTKESGEIICKATAEEFHDEEIPKLVTIKTQEKQVFLHKLLFEDLGNIDNVWLGLETGEDNALRWNDGTELSFTNWATGAVSNKDRRCAQMESGEGAYETGKWVMANCKRKNAVVCERTQPWNLADLQKVILNLKLEVSRNNQAWEETFRDAKKETEEKLKESNQKIADINQKIEQEIASLKQNTVPLGFIYVQLPGKDSPETLWPQTIWKNVGSEYAGLFFRVEGGGAAPFGDLQADNTRRLLGVTYAQSKTWSQVTVPKDGSWSTLAYSGSFSGTTHYGTKYRLSTGEIRPQNKAVRIWQRIK